MNTPPCKLGIIGTGRIGRLHAENIQAHLPQFQLIGVADPCLDKAWAANLSVPLCETSPEAILTHPEIEAVLIASPSSLHIEHLIMASESGKAIFCEKPLGLTEEDIIAALAVIDRNKTLLQIGFNRRFDPHFANLQQRVIAGEIGRSQVLKITSRDPVCPSKDYIAHSGGIFMDMTIHDFDMARFIMGSEVVEVYASGAVLINPDFEAFNDVDTAIVQLRFANGALGIIDNSRQAVYGYDQRLEIFGSQGMLWADNQLQHGVHKLDHHGNSRANPQYFFLERYQQAYINELSAFYHAWHHHQPSPVPGVAGLQALRIALAAKNSLENNKPVHVSNAR